MKKWVWITIPAVTVGLGLVFLGGSVFAQEPGNNGTPGVNWTAMYDYCRNWISGNATVPDAGDIQGTPGFCRDAAEFGIGPGGTTDGVAGRGGMNGNWYAGRGMMDWR